MHVSSSVTQAPAATEPFRSAGNSLQTGMFGVQLQALSAPHSAVTDRAVFEVNSADAAGTSLPSAPADGCKHAGLGPGRSQRHAAPSWQCRRPLDARCAPCSVRHTSLLWPMYRVAAGPAPAWDAKAWKPFVFGKASLIASADFGIVHGAGTSDRSLTGDLTVELKARPYRLQEASCRSLDNACRVCRCQSHGPVCPAGMCFWCPASNTPSGPAATCCATAALCLQTC